MELFVFPPGLGQPSLSPFCVKTMVWMRLAGIEHTVKPGDVRKSPSGKLPVLRVGGKLVSDSTTIQRLLVRERGDPLDAALTPDQRALGHAVQRTCEEHLYWAAVWLRWVHPPGWALVKEAFRDLFPAPLAPLLMAVVRRTPRRQLAAQGLGRHDEAEIVRRAIADLDALETLVGQGPFLFGAEPSSYDVILYAFVSVLARFPLEHPLTRHARSLTALSRLCEALQARLDETPEPQVRT
jgi:glutathione S-transferase